MSHFDNIENLTEGNSLPCEKHGTFIKRMHDTINQFKIDAVTKSITHCKKAPQLYHFSNDLQKEFHHNQIPLKISKVSIITNLNPEKTIRITFIETTNPLMISDRINLDKEGSKETEHHH